MDDNQAFMELSALLTGLREQIIDDSEDHELFKPIAAEYLRRLSAVLPEEMKNLLAAYKTLAIATPKPDIDDTLLGTLQKRQDFIDAKFAAKQIVNIWYFSQFHATEEDEKNSHFLDGGFYERGAIWRLIKAHPIGFSKELHGYWKHKP
jgi:hypothetical protein